MPTDSNSPDTPALVRRRAVVHGRVQGVWYRDSCRRVATAHGVGGWAVNRLDGTVEVLLEGHPDAVAAVIDWCRAGPPRAQVTGVDVTDESPDPELRRPGFHIA